MLLINTILTLALLAAARPTENARTISLPLRRLESDDNVHPAVRHQLHANHAEKRYAQLIGRAGPSDHELLQRRRSVEKRFNRSGLQVASQSKTSKREKRFNRLGVVKSEPQNTAAIALHDAQDDSPQPIVNCDKGATRKLTATATSPAATLPAPISSPSAAVRPPPPPPSASQVSNKTADHSEKLEIIANDVGYFARVQIGTPPRDFKILMDSGSSDFWVGSEKCRGLETGGGCGPHVFLGPQGSSSFRESTEPFQTKYGTGQVEGLKVTDTINMVGLKLDNHPFGVATVESKEFSGDAIQFDGLMGLARSTLSNQKTLTPVEALAKKNLIKEAIVSYAIPRRADKKDNGLITFGGLDTSRFDPNTLVELDNASGKGFWEAKLDNVKVDNLDMGFTGRTAILDTGTTLILAPVEDAVKIHKQIPRSAQTGNTFQIPCDTKTVVTLSFGGRAFNIDPRDLSFAELGNGMCASGISGGSLADPKQWLVGDTFLKSAYFSTNVNTNKMKLAELK